MIVHRVFAIAAACLLASAAQGADVSIGYVQGPGGFYNPVDRSGPYSISSSGVITLLGSGATGGAGGSVTQGTTPWAISGPVTQSGSWSVGVSSLPAVTGSVAVTNLPSTQAVSGSVSVTSLPAVTGSVSVSNLPATQPVSGAVSVSAFPTCPPVTGTLSSVGDSVTITCADTSALRAIVTPNQSAPLVGTVTATDPISGVTRAIFKNVTGEMDTSSVVYMNGLTATSELAFVAFDGVKLTLTAVTSGSASVTLMASHATRGTFQNNPVHTSSEAALRNGRAFTATTGIQAVSANNYVWLLFSIPSTANYRAVIYDRQLNCNQATATTPGEYYGVSNPTVNLTGGTAATITNRKTGGATSLAAVTYAMASTHPDTSPAATNPTGGFLKTGGDATSLGNDYIRTVEPGTSFVNWIGGSGGGLAAASRCYISFLWYEETIQ